MRTPLLALVLLAAACTDAAGPTSPMAPVGPLSSTAVASGGVLNPANGHYYTAVAVPTGIIFADAKKAAVNLAHPVCRWGYLASVTSSTENAFIMKNFPEVARSTKGFINTYGYWLGAQRVNGSWTWLTKEKWGYYPKAPATPTTRPTMSYYAKAEGEKNSGLWSPVYAKQKMPGYIVEWEQCEPEQVPYGYAPGDPDISDLEEEQPAVDQTAPEIVPVIEGTQGTDGWYTSNVALSWTVSDDESDVSSAQGCDATQVAEDTRGVTFTCTATSAGGTRSQAVTLKRDASEPVVAGALSGKQGDNGWYTSDVSIAWTTEDGTSGVASTSGCAATGTTDTPGTTVTCTVVNGAGISASRTVTYRRDTTAPTLEGFLVGQLGANGWYVSDVNMTWTPGDDLSGIAATSGCVNRGTTDTRGTSVVCTVTNGAGLSTSRGLTYKRDATAPVLKGAATGQLGANGWYVSDVELAWTPEDDVSGVASLSECATRGTADTPGTTVSCTAVNGAGLATTETVTYKRDASAPSLEGVLVGKLGTNDWFISDVGMTWTPRDEVSGIATASGCVTSGTTDTDGTTVTCTVTNGAGKSASRQLTYKRDATQPAVAFQGAQPTYTVDQTVDIRCAAADLLSGIATSSCADIRGSASSFTVGVNRRRATATDRASNVSDTEVTFTVTVTYASLSTLVERHVTQQGVANSLNAKLRAAQSARTAEVKQNHLNAFRNEVSAQRGKHIPTQWADQLLRLVDHV